MLSAVKIGLFTHLQPGF